MTINRVVPFEREEYQRNKSKVQLFILFSLTMKGKNGFNIPVGGRAELVGEKVNLTSLFFQKEGGIISINFKTGGEGKKKSQKREKDSNI